MQSIQISVQLYNMAAEHPLTEFNCHMTDKCRGQRSQLDLSIWLGYALGHRKMESNFLPRNALLHCLSLSVTRDPYPQWRKMEWSPDCAFLVLAYGIGHVECYDLSASKLFTIEYVSDIILFWTSLSSFLDKACATDSSGYTMNPN